jgi:Mg-chelatase subunit ChlD
MTHGFGNRHIEIGDLNSSNLERRLNEISWGGKTYIMPAWKAALADYDEEFGDRDPDEQPTMLTLVVTDGEADDWMEFEPVLEKASAKRVFVVAIVGHGHKHDATLTAYQQAARKNAARDKFGKVHVEVVSFDAVTDPDEIALDLITLVS